MFVLNVEPNESNYSVAEMIADKLECKPENLRLISGGSELVYGDLYEDPRKETILQQCMRLRRGG